VKGLNFFAAEEHALLHAIQDPKGSIAGFRRGDLLAELTIFSPTRLSRQLRRLLDIGLIKRVIGRYRYYLTKPGRAATAAAAHLVEATIIPALI
jgi:DNA-binding HxlR family transcriptional regulator